ncbi:MAG: hypothetical protein AB7I59_12715 [Geminicoccaceae bacterium]
MMKPPPESICPSRALLTKKVDPQDTITHPDILSRHPDGRSHVFTVA